MVRPRQEACEISGDRTLRIVLDRFRAIDALRQGLAYFRLWKRRVQYRVGEEIQAAIEIFLQELASDRGCRAFAARIREKRATQKIQLFGELVGRPFRGPLAQKLSGDAGAPGQIRRISLRTALYQNA